MRADIAAELDCNFAAFEKALPMLIVEYAGQFVLMHRGEVKGIYANGIDATVVGLRDYGAGDFSVQEVTQEKENLGFYSYVGGTGQC